MQNLARFARPFNPHRRKQEESDIHAKYTKLKEMMKMDKQKSHMEKDENGKGAAEDIRSVSSRTSGTKKHEIEKSIRSFLVSKKISPFRKGLSIAFFMILLVNLVCWAL